MLFPLDKSERVFLRARLDTEAGTVRGFAVQLEVVIEDAAHIVIRFDTAHGYVHQHVFDPTGGQRRVRLRVPDWGQAYTYCYEYVRRNWQPEIARFERKLR
jgi:hypothetical protein